MIDANWWDNHNAEWDARYVAESPEIDTVDASLIGQHDGGSFPISGDHLTRYGAK